MHAATKYCNTVVSFTNETITRECRERVGVHMWPFWLQVKWPPLHPFSFRAMDDSPEMGMGAGGPSTSRTMRAKTRRWKA